jgi:hypothetical protein
MIFTLEQNKFIIMSYYRGDKRDLNFSVLGYLKNEVYKRQINYLSELIEEVTNCFVVTSMNRFKKIFLKIVECFILPYRLSDS